MVDPLAAMRAACLAVAAGEVAEVELIWTDAHDDGREVRLEITVRRDIRPLIVGDSHL